MKGVIVLNNGARFALRKPHFYDFTRKYLPVLKRFPAKYIYDPWNSPLSVQQAAGCVIGKDYPKPIVDHNKAVTKNLARMKQAREAKYGSKQGELCLAYPFLFSFPSFFHCSYCISFSSFSGS